MRHRAAAVRRAAGGARLAAGWLAWTAASATPATGCLAFLAAAWRLRRPRLIVTAVIYLIWPLVGLIGGAVMAGLFFQRGLNLSGLTTSIADQNAAEVLLAAIWLSMWVVSIINAQLEWRTMIRQRRRQNEALASIDDDALPSSRPYWICLVMWITLGWSGAHRLYTGRWVSGLLYMATLGLFGAGWACDLFLLRRMLLKAPQLTGAEREHEVAPWAGAEERHGWLDFGLRLLFFLTAPFMFVEVCVYFHHLELLAVLVMTVVVCGLLGDLRRVIGRLGFLERIPLTRPAVGFFRDLYSHYYENQPRPFLYYVLLPLAAPVAVFVSPSARGELWLYGKFLLTLSVVIIVQQLQSFGTSYQYMPPLEAAGWLAFHLGFAAAVTVLFLIPIATTSFNLNLAGKQKRLRTLSALLLSTTLPIAGLTFYMVNHLKTPTWVSWKMLESRIESPRFRRDLQTESEIFLKHYVSRVPGVEPPRWAALHSALTGRYQKHVSTVVRSDEARAFQVRLISFPGDDRPSLAVTQQWRLGSIETTQTLFLMTSDGQFFSKWERLPPQAAIAFAAIEDVPLEASEHRIAQRSFAADARIYELLADYLWREAGPLELGEQRARPTFQAKLSAGLRRTLQQQQVAGAEAFRVFGWDDGQQQWLGVRDSRHAWLLASSAGRFLEQWDLAALPWPSHDRAMLRRIEDFDPVASLDFQLKMDVSLARDLIREHTAVFLTEAARWRRGESLISLSRSYRQFISRLVPAPQLPRFEVVRAADSGWLGVAYQQLPLFTASPQGEFFQRGEQAPQVARQFLDAPLAR